MNILIREEKLIKLLKDCNIYETFMYCFNMEQDMRKECHLDYYKCLRHLIMRCNNYGQNEICMAFNWNKYGNMDYNTWDNISMKWNKIIMNSLY